MPARLAPARIPHLGPLLPDHGVGIRRKRVAPEADGLALHADDRGVALKPEGNGIAREASGAGSDAACQAQVPDQPEKPQRAHFCPTFAHENKRLVYQD